MSIQLRDYQQSVFDDINNMWDSGKNNIVAVLPTGAGKTILFSKLIETHNGSSVAIAHRQELVCQIALAFAKCGIYHRIIAPGNVIRNIVKVQMMELGRSFYDANAKCGVIGVDTLVRRGDELRDWLNSITLMVQDECFPSGTMIGDIPIEDIRVGDYVDTYNEKTSSMERRKVVRLFKNLKPKKMVRLTMGNHVIDCTENHPILTQKGWTDAKRINPNDTLYMVQNKNHKVCKVKTIQLPKNRTLLLFKKMLNSISFKTIKRDNEENEPQICVKKNEGKQSNELRGNQSKSQCNTQEDRTQAESSWWKWKTTYKGREKIIRFIMSFGFLESNCYKNRWLQTFRQLPALLQSGLWSLQFKDSNRSRWFKSRFNFSKKTGCEERQTIKAYGVDSVEILKQDNYGKLDIGSERNYVYNFEVEDLHTYTANGFIVHNCHHVLQKNKWGKAATMFPNARMLGVTATPERADGNGLGRHHDGLFDDMIVGPTMRELIDRGYLTDYRIFAPPGDLDLSSVEISKATGDYSKVKLSTAVEKSHILGDVVKHYIKIANGKLGITFCTNVEQATKTAENFNNAGVPAMVVSAKTPDIERAEILQKFKKRELLQLVNVDLFGEGFDLPSIEVVSMARPTKSYGLFIQIFGRALRPSEGKKTAIIIDHVGNVMEHGLPDAQRVWSLDRRPRRSKGPADTIPCKICTDCTGVFEKIYKECPYCGHIDEPTTRTNIKYVDGDLFELDTDTLKLMRGDVDKIDQSGEDFKKECEEKHMKPEWIGAHAKRHLANQESQVTLRETLAKWSGIQRFNGHTDSEIYRLFYFKFGVDMLTAQGLKKKECLELNDRVLEKC